MIPVAGMYAKVLHRLQRRLSVRLGLILIVFSRVMTIDIVNAKPFVKKNFGKKIKKGKDTKKNDYYSGRY